MDITPVVLTFSVLFSVLFFMVGGLAIWILRDLYLEQKEFMSHPELYDEDGNLISSEFIAFRFQDFEEEDEDED
jgi:hypothetical protein